MGSFLGISDNRNISLVGTTENKRPIYDLTDPASGGGLGYRQQQASEGHLVTCIRHEKQHHLFGLPTPLRVPFPWF